MGEPGEESWGLSMRLGGEGRRKCRRSPGVECSSVPSLVDSGRELVESLGWGGAPGRLGFSHAYRTTSFGWGRPIELYRD